MRDAYGRSLRALVLSEHQASLSEQMVYVLLFLPSSSISHQNVGERPQDSQHLLHQVQQAQCPQGNPIQGRKG